MESRICTKTYSEECYTEFCNTTRTWKITCPCKGRMCNVRDVPRERELFDILNKLVDKTYKNYRFKRSNTMKYMSIKAQLDQDHTVQDRVVKRSIPMPSNMNEQIAEQDLARTPMPSVMATTASQSTRITWYAWPVELLAGLRENPNYELREKSKKDYRN